MKPLSHQRDAGVSLSDLQHELNNLLSRLWHGGLVTKPFDGQDWAPRLDLIEEPGRYVIRAEVPGVHPEDIEVSVLGGTVTLRGHKPPPDLPPETARLVFGETQHGSFHRQVSLPQEVDADRVGATGADGVLTLTLPKAGPCRGKPVSVEVKPG